MRIPETGRVVCCDGPEKLAGAVIELLRDREMLSHMGQAAREWVVDRFDWPTLTRQAVEFFAELETGADSHRRCRRTSAESRQFTSQGAGS